MHSLLFPALLLFSSLVFSAEPEALIRRGDQAFNRGDYAEAGTLYDRARIEARQANRADLLCELENDQAALAMAQENLPKFHQFFANATRCMRAASPRAVTQQNNLLTNGGFEEGLRAPWGTGHYEDSAGKSGFGVWWNAMNARAFMKLDRDRPASGCCALRITNHSPAAAHVFTTTSQRIAGLTPNTLYRVSLQARAEKLARGAVSFAVDAGWGKRLLSLPEGTWDWRPFSGVVNIGHNDYIDLRLIHQNTGTLWLDDLEVTELAAGGDDPASLLQRAESLKDQARFDDALALCTDLEQRFPENLHARHLRGRIQLLLGRYDEALQAFQSLDEKGFRDAPLALGDLYHELGEWERADADYQRALKKVEGDQGTYSLVLDRIAANDLSRGDLDGALNAQQQSLHILRHIGDLHGQAQALATLGEVQSRLGRGDTAASSIDEAIALARRLQDRRLLAELLTRRAGLPSKDAAALLEEALKIQEEIGDPRGHIATLYARGLLYRDKGIRDKALADLRQAVTLLGELYDRLGGLPRETRQTFVGQFADIYRDLMDLLLEQHNAKPSGKLADEALRIAEESRARAFTEMVNETRAARLLVGEGGDPKFKQRIVEEREARLALEAVNRRLATLLADAPDLPALRQQQAKAKAEAAYRAAYGTLAQEFPRFADLKRPTPVGVNEIQKLLDPDEALLAFFVTARHTAVWALDRKQARLAVLPLGREELARRTAPLREAMPALAEALQAVAQDPSLTLAEEAQRAAQRFDPADAHELYKTLIGPVADLIRGKGRLFLVPDDLLYRLPFEALPTRAPSEGEPAYWVRTQALSYLPSAAVLRSLRSFHKEAGAERRPLAAFADPIFDQAGAEPSTGNLAQRGAVLRRLREGGAIERPALDRLPETAEEALTAARLLGGRPEDLFLRERASERQVKGMPLRDYRYLLFATHGLLAGEFRPGLQPALALSFVGDPQNDGLLEMGEILGLDLNADLVVLSACNTGRAGGEGDRGEGFTGLTRSFMYAGAEAMAVTLWPVESDSARRLTEAAYRSLAQPRSEGGSSRAQAFAQAKRAMIDQPRDLALDRKGKVHISTAHPFFWAPFILVGEGR